MSDKDQRKANPHFGSDNYAGVCPEVWKAYDELGRGHIPSYGEDALTRRARRAIRKFFDNDDCEVFFVFNGTAANALALATVCQSYHGVICPRTAHLATDECGAPGFFSNGVTLLGVGEAVPDEGDRHAGKIRPKDIADLRTERVGDVHFPKPGAVSVAQATELGTLYSPSELRALCRAAHGPARSPNGMPVRGTRMAVHMDGARFANALAALEVHPRDLSWKAGVDVLSFGGTKMGMPPTEAVVFFDRDLARDFDYRRKQAGQLASKMRFLAIPWIAMLENDVWLGYARNANERAAELTRLVGRIPGLRVAFRREANAVFVKLPPNVVECLRSRWAFYPYFGVYSRFMCSWDTTNEDVSALAADIAQCVRECRRRSS